MIFALFMDDGELMAFSSEEEAVSYCESYDVTNGLWAFFADDGAALAPQFKSQRRFLGMKVDVPGYTLDQSKRLAAANLIERLSEVRNIEHGPFHTIFEVQEYLSKSGRVSL